MWVCWNMRALCELKDEKEKNSKRASLKQDAGEGSAARNRTDTSSSQVMELPPASPGPLPTRPQHSLLSSPLLTLSDCVTLAHAFMVLHTSTWSAGSPIVSYWTLTSSQTQFTDHLLWETLLIPALKESKCSSLAIKDIRYIGVFIPSNFPPEWKYLKDYAQFTQIEHSRKFEWMTKWMRKGKSLGALGALRWRKNYSLLQGWEGWDRLKLEEKIELLGQSLLGIHWTVRDDGRIWKHGESLAEVQMPVASTNT